ncbi:transmembrane protein 161B-like [Diaphorina citri]|uniref:Transmembrane protein 161B-like n=1 Tax=Diaphorina citri TaxID=121845 RepID=A0A3Q0J115_DIACI|nr:transmembrane protein 161B-like [Diaphorina citri]
MIRVFSLGSQMLSSTILILFVLMNLSPHFGALFVLIFFPQCVTLLTKIQMYVQSIPCRLIRYLYPTNDELRTLAGVPKERSKSKRNSKEKKYERNGSGDQFSQSKETFHVPKNINLELQSAKITSLDVVHLRYYSEYQWLLDYALYSLFVYTLTEVYTSFIPLDHEINLSMLWCLVVQCFTLKILFTLTLEYFKGEESVGERSTVIVTGFAYLVIAMMILIVDEAKLETGLHSAYASFNESAATFLHNQGLNSEGPASKIIINFCIAIWCALIGALFTFPGLRMARMHWDSLNFYVPHLIPVPSRRLTESGFDSLRLVLIVVLILQRLALMPIYLQAYLNMAYARVEEQRKEAGRITNVELQKKIAAVFYYLCVVTLQYVAPLLMCLFFTLMYKSLGKSKYKGSRRVLSSSSGLPESPPMTLALDSLKLIFTTDVFRGIFGFATWWVCFAWFASSALGMVYLKYFANSK